MRANGERTDANPREPNEAAVERTGTFNLNRPLLFSIAYRMLGSVMDAENAVQETFVRWQRAPEGEIRSPRAYLSAVGTRLCIDQLRSARREESAAAGAAAGRVSA